MAQILSLEQNSETGNKSMLKNPKVERSVWRTSCHGDSIRPPVNYSARSTFTEFSTEPEKASSLRETHQSAKKK
ncbi:uncharacterized [Tachysurus ichikawai]